ncbi:MAG: hypothetical protein WC747_01930 [Candidatus Babeliales bacterium]|jgi:hypothetical protein
MNKKTIFIFASLFIFYKTDCFYMNDEEITFKTIFTGSCATSIQYNILNNKDGSIGGDKRLFGIHNMTVEIPGYEVVHLIENDICLHPSLFTMASIFLSDDNVLVQRWACVKWILPLSFGFKVENNSLNVFSSIWKYRFLAPLRAQKIIELVKKENFDEAQSLQGLMIKVTVNGRSVVACQHTVVQIYSLSSNSQN